MIDLTTLSETQLNDLAIALQEEIQNRQQIQKEVQRLQKAKERLSKVRGHFELRGIKRGQKTHYYWYFRYYFEGKLQTKYLGARKEGALCPQRYKDKAAAHLDDVLGR